MKLPPHKYEPFTVVYMRTNSDKSGMVTGYIARLNCPIQYLVMWSDDSGEGAHWEQELTDEKTFGAGEEEA